MRANTTKQEWLEWKEKHLKNVSDILNSKEIILDFEQPHISGERYLMSGKKLVLQGTCRKTGAKVIIKYSSEPEIISEIKKERMSKKTIEDVDFAYKSIYFPTEFLYEENPNYSILITELIPQETVFVKMPFEEQFFLSLKALEAFEGIHSVVGKHEKSLITLKSSFSTKKYLEEFVEQFNETKKILEAGHVTIGTLSKIHEVLLKKQSLIEKYCDFLTHDDFVPHNMVIKDSEVYVLDQSSLILGNKYESWARFLNFMTIFNIELNNALLEFVVKNRGYEEFEVLSLMRLYKISFLLNYYAKSNSKTSGNLQKLQEMRLLWWTKIADKILNNQIITKEDSEEHLNFLRELRDEDEKKRQRTISG